MVDYGVNVTSKTTSVATPVVAKSGIPYVVGRAPVQSAGSAAKVGTPVLCTSWAEAVEKFGFSENWSNYELCEFMYSHFKLFAAQPVIMCNVLDHRTMKTAVNAADMAVTDHKVNLPISAINDATLVVQTTDATPCKKNTDYSTYYNGESLVIELLPDGDHYDAVTLKVAYNQANPSAVVDADIAAGIESVELCATMLGIVPDLICAPGWSSKPTIAAAMTAKAGSINGLFTAKALIDIDCSKTGSQTYQAVCTMKNSSDLVSEDQILCWPMVKLGNYQFHMSTQLAGLMAKIDSANGCPYESPSNKNLQCDGAVLKDGTEVNLTLTQANYLRGHGIVTALNFMSGWVAWGSYTACYPISTDVKDYMLPVSRTLSWVGNTLIKTYWSQLDKLMNRRLIDTIKDSVNIWLNGLVGGEYLLGARVEILEDENPETDLMAGIIRFHIYVTPPSQAQRIDFILEYDSSYVATALST